RRRLSRKQQYRRRCSTDRLSRASRSPSLRHKCLSSSKLQFSSNSCTFSLNRFCRSCNTRCWRRLRRRCNMFNRRRTIRQCLTNYLRRCCNHGRISNRCCTTS
ncbi:hypothetical protein JG688_00012403, partial [Phytophthora aleatoria]